MLNSTRSTQNTKPKQCKIKSKEPERSNLITCVDDNHSGMWMTFTTARFLTDFKTKSVCALPWPPMDQRIMLQKPLNAPHPCVKLSLWRFSGLPFFLNLEHQVPELPFVGNEGDF